MSNILKATIWGRELSLPIVFERYKGESVTAEQTHAMDVFTSHLVWVEKAKKKVESYCKEYVEGDVENQNKDNIFSYIKPETVFVKREKEHPRVALICQYRYDPEHGLAIVFSQDGHVNIGFQDIIL